MSASCSIDPDSLRSDSAGRLSGLFSLALFSWLHVMIVIQSSFASSLSFLVIKEISLTRLSELSHSSWR